jgi:hypothetical protein
MRGQCSVRRPLILSHTPPWGRKVIDGNGVLAIWLPLHREALRHRRQHQNCFNHGETLALSASRQEPPLGKSEKRKALSRAS